MKRTIIFCAILTSLYSPISKAQTIDYISSALWNSVYDFKISGDYGYAAFQNGLMILDITALDNIYEVSKLYLQGEGRDIEIVGNYLYLADGSAGIQIIDITDPFNPLLAGSFPVNMASDIFIRGNLAFIAAGQSGAMICDITNPVDPIVISSYDTAGACDNIFVLDTLLFAPFSRTLHIVNIADSANPLHIGTYQGFQEYTRSLRGITGAT